MGELGAIREKHKGKKIGFASGVFDLMHQGHLNFINQAKAICDILVVAVNTDKYVKDIKKSNSIMDEISRIALVDSLKGVDYTIFLETSSRLKILGFLKPNVITLPCNHQDSNERLEIYKAMNIKINITPYTKGVSTTQIKKKFSVKN